MKRLTCNDISSYKNITVGKNYVGVVEEGKFKIINDSGRELSYPLTLFGRLLPNPLAEIKIKYNNFDDNVKVSFRNIREQYLYPENTAISCGILYLSGINSLKDLVKIIHPSLSIPTEEIFAYIIVNVIKTLKYHYNHWAFLLLSTNIGEDSSIFKWLDDNSIFHEDEENPNSGNIIRLWVLT
jgi:hypothetical protein